jgi:hypothetical protein
LVWAVPVTQEEKALALRFGKTWEEYAARTLAGSAEAKWSSIRGLSAWPWARAGQP